jgi:hypothetical protein
MRLDSINAETQALKEQSVVNESISGLDRAGLSVFSRGRMTLVILLFLAALLSPIVNSALASGDELTADWMTPTQKCHGHTVRLMATPIPNGSLLTMDFYLEMYDHLSIGYSDVDLEVYDDRGEKIPLKALGGGADRWGAVFVNSRGGTASGDYDMTLKTGRHPSTATLTYHGEKCTFKFAVWRD